MTSLLWILIAIQVVMGVFDTFYHHELTERLAWRPSQRYELQLHALRNVLYALPPRTVVFPGHGPRTTIEEEMLLNPFVPAG